MEVGSAYNYENLLEQVKQQAINKVGGEKMAKISSLLGQAGLVNAELSQFGFYKTLGNLFKEKATETIQQVLQPKQQTPLGTEGTALKEFQSIGETEASPELQQIKSGVFGREILGERPDEAEIQPQAQFNEVDEITDRPVVPTELEPQSGLFDELVGGARESLASDVQGLTQSIRGSIFGSASSLYDKAINYKQSLESGIDRLTTLRNQATDFAQQLKGQATDLQSQGKSLIQQGQDLLSRGEQSGQDLVSQGQTLLDKSAQQLANSDIFQSALDTAREKITQGQQLVNNGDRSGLSLLQEGQEQLEQAQSSIQGLGGQARGFSEQIQTEIESRTQQINNLAENLASQAKTGLQQMSDIGNAIKSGDIEGATQGIQSGVKTVGQLAEKAGVAGAEEAGATISEAIPVIGEIASAGLLIASLFTGFTPHESVPSITTATTAYGV